MSVLIDELYRVIQDHPWQEKWLLVPHMADGYQLMETLARQGKAWMNLRPITPAALAEKLLEDDIKNRGLRLIDWDEALLLIENILVEMQARGELQYFAPIYEMGILGRMLLPALIELRMAGVDPVRLSPDSFIDMQKGKEIQQLFNAYDLALEAGICLDPALLYARATEHLQHSPEIIGNVIILIPEQLDLSLYDYLFIEKILQNGGLLLPEEKVLNVPNPSDFRFKTDAKVAIYSPFSCLYAPDAAPAWREEVSIYRSYGVVNEIKEMLRRVKSHEASLDQVLVCYTNEATYLPQLYAQLEALTIPVTFSGGIPVGFSRPGRLLEEILCWVESDYSGEAFYQLLTGGNLIYENGMQAGRLLRRTGICKGRENYADGLNRLQKQIQTALERLDEKDRAGSYQERENEGMERLIALTEGLFAHLDAAGINGDIDFPVFCQGLAGLLNTYARMGNPLDGGARPYC